MAALEAKWINTGKLMSWSYVLWDVVKLSIAVASGSVRAGYVVFGGRLDLLPAGRLSEIVQGGQWDGGRLLDDEALWTLARGTTKAPPAAPTSVATVPLARVPIHTAEDAGGEWGLVAIAVLASGENWMTLAG